MKTKIFSLLIMGGAIAFASCQGSGDGTTDTGDSTAIQSAPDNTTVDENKTDSNLATTSTLDDNTQKFVMEAASGGMMEVELGQLAQQKASSQRVKDFGAMMVRDHSKANNDLKAAVSGKATIPASMEDNHQEHVNDLTKKTGTDFDKAYIKMMVDDHEKDIKKFEDASKDAKDPAVKDFATNTLPTLRQHLAEAKSIRDELSKMKK
jgi:putative membrane protein